MVRAPQGQVQSLRAPYPPVLIGQGQYQEPPSTPVLFLGLMLIASLLCLCLIGTYMGAHALGVLP